MKLKLALAGLCVAGAMMLGPANAMPLGSGAGAVAQIDTAQIMEEVQFGRRGRRGGRGRGIGPGIGLGLGIGSAVIIGGAIAAAEAEAAARRDAVAYCMRRFRSYNPETGTYRGRDGRDYYCP